ncbi:hypothetical protein CMI37_07725 [Candidatus Pacearchaeota archaeon]|nr:hypothetical protein [Candidatus Pacearchaeota archaeon]|tara:strand:+ start:1245 stop:2318 length:1074 start_codon:yes stop_codon:yes gene_type:complete
MVNKVVLNYLKKYKGKYDILDLKKKLLASGYPKKDVQEAVRLVTLKEVPEVVDKKKAGVKKQAFVRKERDVIKKDEGAVRKEMPLRKEVVEGKRQAVKSGVPRRGFKWMKLAGILGLVLLVLSLVSVVLSLVSVDIPVDNAIVSIIISVVFFLVVLFFFFGFVKLGKHTSCKLLKFSSWVLFGLIILGFILMIVSIVLSFTSMNSAVLAGLTGRAVDVNMMGGMEGTDGFGGLDISSLDLGIDSLFSATGIIALVIFVFIIVVLFLFYISLLKIREQVKFAKISGILGLVLMIGSVLLFGGFLVMIFLNPLGILAIILNPMYSMILMIVSLVFGVVSLALLLFKSLMLFNASKKFEG